jgi:diguanylate cyclase (GGDEF)-like protein/PAS domain S-box-containing protein
MDSDPVTLAPPADGSVVAGRPEHELARQWELSFRMTSTGIAITHPETGILRAVNPAFASMHGGQPEDFVGKPLAMIFTADSAARVPELAEIAEADGYMTYESEHVRLDGSIFPVAAEVFAARDDDGTLLYRIGYMTDLTEKRAAEVRHRALRTRFETAFSDAPIGMTLVALDGRFLKVNRALCELTGYTEDELQGLTFQDITHADDLDVDLAHVGDLIDGRRDKYQMEKRYLTKSGAVIWVQLSVSIVRDEVGRPLYFISQIQDITERKRIEEHLHRLADQDSLTGLWNRRRFEEELVRQIGRCKRYAERATLLYIDLDEFKKVNDHLGHKVGDDLLRVVGRRMANRLRSSDSVARIGGDEFAVILTAIHPQHATTIANEFVDLIRTSQLTAGGTTVQCTASVGLVNLDPDTTSDQDVLVAADIAMYAAKATGGDRCHVSDRVHPTAT